MIAIPQGVTVDISGFDVTIKGPKGEVKKRFSGKIKIEKEGENIVVKGPEKEKALMGTTNSLIESMIKGVTEGYSKELRILYSHFPASMEVKGKDILVKNFIGEKHPRKTKVHGDSTKVEVKGQNIKITGPDKHAVSQTFANIKGVLKIREKDCRIFQDGIYEVSE